jgi:hypothetical protein
MAPGDPACREVSPEEAKALARAWDRLGGGGEGVGVSGGGGVSGIGSGGVGNSGGCGGVGVSGSGGVGGGRGVSIHYNSVNHGGESIHANGDSSGGGGGQGDASSSTSAAPAAFTGPPAEMRAGHGYGYVKCIGWHEVMQCI